MTEQRLRKMLATEGEALDRRLYAMLYQLPFQLSELFVLDDSGEQFQCRYFVVRKAMDDIQAHGPKHADASLNVIDAADAAAWQALRTVFEALTYPIPDVWEPNQFGYSVYKDGLADPNTNFRRLQARYSDVLVADPVRQIMGLRDLTLVRVPEGGGGVAGAVRLFNQIRSPRAPQSTSLTYADMLYGSWFEAFAPEQAGTEEVLGSVALASGRVRIRSKSVAMKEVFRRARTAADASSPVLIEGPSGSGKEALARWIHENSSRRHIPLIAENCAAIPESLLESRFFGHVRGAFTDAKSTTPGLFQKANGGTLFLDEIGDMPLSQQPKLLRAIREGEVLKVGSTEVERVDVRILAATNKDLGAEVKAGRFREDLYYRLAVLPIALPPLQERREDIPDLIDDIIDYLSAKNRHPLPVFSPEVKRLLAERRWPGNIGQLTNAIQRLDSFYSGTGVIPLSAVLEVGEGYHAADVAAAMRTILAVARELTSTTSMEKSVLELVEAIAIGTAIDLEGDISKAERALGIAWNTVKKHHIVYQSLLSKLREVGRA